MAKSVKSRQKVKRSKVKRSKVKRSKVKRSKVKRSKMKGGVIPAFNIAPETISGLLSQKAWNEENGHYGLSYSVAQDIAKISQQERIQAIKQLKELDFSWPDITQIEGILSGVGKPLWLDTLVKYGEETVPHKPNQVAIFNTVHSRLNALKEFYRSKIDQVVAEHREAALMDKLF